MTEDTGSIERRVSYLEDNLENILLKDESRRLTLFSAIEKLLLPAAVAAVGLWINLAGQELGRGQLALAKAQAKGQLALAEAQEQRASLEAKTEIRLRTLESFYRYISSHDPGDQKTALYMLTIMEPNVGQMLARAVAANPGMPREIRQIAGKAATNIALVGVLINYRIVVYFPKSKAGQKEKAESLRKSLNEFAPQISVSAAPATDEQLEEWTTPKSNEIRHDPVYEKEAAVQLQTLLSKVFPSKKFNLRQTSTQGRRTEDVLTVFLVD